MARQIWKLLNWRFSPWSAKDIIWTSLGGFNLGALRWESGWFLNCPSPLKSCSDLPEGRVRKHRWVLTSHLQSCCAKANRCSLAGAWCHIPQCPSSVAWNGLCTLGWYICEPYEPLWVHWLVLLMQRNSPARLEQGPLQDTVFVFSRNKVNCIVAFCVVFLHVTKGNQWAFAAFQDFMLMFHCYQYFFFFPPRK